MMISSPWSLLQLLSLLRNKQREWLCNGNPGTHQQLSSQIRRRRYTAAQLGQWSWLSPTEIQHIDPKIQSLQGWRRTQRNEHHWQNMKNRWLANNDFDSVSSPRSCKLNADSRNWKLFCVSSCPCSLIWRWLIRTSKPYLTSNTIALD